ncbi:tRNA nucleotidyltransferase [Vibrio phage RYC]|nr:tRNA nucleotidyltransferase [Vibrio phage RYC]
MMKFYLVGGACRDILMGESPKDFDFVVVEPDEGYFKDWDMVGRDFPVFLEPTHGWEVAFARVERKAGTGHKGFVADTKGVTLEEDLLRRDLTMNAIAIEVDFEATVKLEEPVTVGAWIDPYNGQQDIKSSTLRAVSPAFKEDPLRALRVCRFMSQKDATIPDQTTVDYIQEMRSLGELHTLTKERVWGEMEKALKSPNPSQFFTAAQHYCGMFDNIRWMKNTPQNPVHHPEGDVWVHTVLVMGYAAYYFNDPEINFACFTHDFGKPEMWEKQENAHGHEEAGLSYIEGFCRRWRIPNSYKELALITCEHHTKVHSCFGRDGNNWVKPKSIMKMFEKTGALSKPDRFKKFLKACEADAKGRGIFGLTSDNEKSFNAFISKPYPQRQYMIDCLEAVRNMGTKEISQKMLSEGKDGVSIGLKIREERIKCIRGVQRDWKVKGDSLWD